MTDKHPNPDIEPLPCPFCGEPPLHDEEQNAYTCNDRQCPGWHVMAAKEGWNRRALPPSGEAVAHDDRLPHQLLEMVNGDPFAKYIKRPEQINKLLSDLQQQRVIMTDTLKTEIEQWAEIWADPDNAFVPGDTASNNEQRHRQHLLSCEFLKLKDHNAMLTLRIEELESALSEQDGDWHSRPDGGPK